MLRGFRQKLQERGERKEQERQEVVEQARLASQAEQEERRRQQDIRDRVLVIIREGKVPEMDVQNESVPFKLQRMEKMLLSIGNVPYSEMRVKREIQGRSTGASVRVARGMSVPGRRLPRHSGGNRRAYAARGRAVRPFHKACPFQWRAHISHSNSENCFRPSGECRPGNCP